MDAITLLKDDHKTVEQLFKRFEKAGDQAYKTKREIVDKIIAELSVHAAVEEMLFYPVTRATVPSTENIALESLEEHHIVKWLLSELEDLPAEHERFDAKVSVLMENVRHHAKEEEEDFFPKVRDELGRNALADLGDAMEAAKKTAPTRPHPRSPDTPPGNKVVGTAAGVADRVGDTVSGLAQGGTSAIGDLIATILGRKKPNASPKGSPTSRKVAAKVREQGADVTQSAIDAVREARRVGQAAGRGAKEAATSTSNGTSDGRAIGTDTARGTAAKKAPTRKTAAKKATPGKAAARRTVAQKAGG